MLNFKTLIAAGIGAAVGAGVTYVVTEEITRKKYNKYAEDAIAEMKQLYEERVNGVQEAHIKDIEDDAAKIDALTKRCQAAEAQADYYKRLSGAQEVTIKEMDEKAKAEAPAVEHLPDKEEPVAEENPTMEAMIGTSTLSSSKKATTKKSKKKKEVPEVKSQKQEIVDSRKITESIRIISDVEFDTEDDYTPVYLVYDPNKDTLYDEDCSILDIEERLGSRDVFDHLGEFSECKVWVANDYFMEKYEVAYYPNYDVDDV